MRISVIGLATLGNNCASLNVVTSFTYRNKKKIEAAGTGLEFEE